MHNHLRPRYSLLTLLLMMSFVALCVALWSNHQQLKETLEKVVVLKEELGYFSIEDATKIHVRKLDTTIEDKTWKWRIYLPEDRHFSLHLVTDSVPEAGIPGPSQRKETVRSLPTGELILQAGIRKNGDGSWGAYYSYTQEEISLDRRSSTGGSGGIRMHEENHKALEIRTVGSIGDIPDSGPYIDAADKPVILCRFRPGLFQPLHPDKEGPDYDNAGTFAQPEGLCKGLVIWIEQTK